jgi:hypothetical protein
VDTPDWIKAHCESHPSGGWFHPIALSSEHPAVAEGWKCFDCGDGFTAREVAMVMPFHGGEDHGGDRWIAMHRECSAKNLFKDPEMKAKLRPTDYASLSPEDQWQIDKRLGILDWKGS